MNFKRYIKYWVSAAAACGMLFAACDDVSDDDRYREAPEVTPMRGVLLVDFTGQNCTNCPTAHETIEQLEEQYGRDKLIGVSVHSGSLAIKVSRTNFETGRIGLMCDEGQALSDAWGITTWPRGVVNLTGSSMNFDEWSYAVYNVIGKSSGITIDAKATYAGKEDVSEETENGRITITADIVSESDINDAYVQFWVTQDNIKAPQKFVDHTEDAYNHNNVFRAMVFGQPGQNTTVKAGEKVTVTGSIDSRYNNKERWEINDLYVIAYVYESGKGVREAVRVKVIPSAVTE